MSEEAKDKMQPESILAYFGGALIILGGLLFLFIKYIPDPLAHIIDPFNYFSLNPKLLGILGIIVGIVVVILGAMLLRSKENRTPLGLSIVVLSLISIVTSAFGLVAGGALTLVAGMVAVSSSPAPAPRKEVKSPPEAAPVTNAPISPSELEQKKEIVPVRSVDYSASKESSPLVKPKAGEELVPIIVEPHNADRLRVLERTLIDIEKCPNGGEWIPPYRRKDGKLVKGHCRKIKEYQNISKASVKKEYKTLLKEQEAGPKVIGYEKKSPETEKNAR